MGYLYILYSERLDRYYIGSTNDIIRRIAEHNSGHTTATRAGIVWKIVFQREMELSLARRTEYKLKRMRRRDYIEDIVRSGILRMNSAPT